MCKYRCMYSKYLDMIPTSLLINSTMGNYSIFLCLVNQSNLNNFGFFCFRLQLVLFFSPLPRSLSLCLQRPAAPPTGLISQRLTMPTDLTGKVRCLPCTYIQVQYMYLEVVENVLPSTPVHLIHLSILLTRCRYLSIGREWS